MKTNYIRRKVMSRLALILGIFLSQSFIINAQCSGSFIIEDPEDFQWTYHPVSGTNPEAYYSGTMEVGDTTFTFSNGETLTTRAYKQKGLAYSIPGPTLRMAPGNKYVLSLHNLLPYEAKSMQMNVFKDPNVVNLHTHGLHISGESPGDDVHRSFEGGRGGDFVYDIPADHMGGTFWYHAHHHGATTLQVSGGMMGMIIIDDANDNIPAPVAAMEEKVLQMAKIDPTVAGLGGDQLISGTMSDARWMVNGIIGGEICMPPNTWQHWRVSVADPMAMLRDVSFGPECDVMVLSRDGVWRTVAPLDLTDNTLKLTGASRADFAIRASGNSIVKMGNMTIATISVNGVADPAPHPFDTDGVSQWSATRPNYLRDLRNEPIVHNESISMGARTVNGTKFDHMVPNLTLPTTDVQEWSLSGNVRHPFHLHIYHVQALVDDRDFEAGEYYDVVASQMDVRFDLNASTTTTFSGATIMHCHILEHEDRGAMGWLNVVGGEGPPTFPADMDTTVSFGEYYILGGGNQNQVPQSASNVQATATSSSSIDLGWDDNSSDEDGFYIERSLDGTNFNAIATTGVDAVSYTDNGLSASTTYYYRVVAFNGVGNSGPSNITNATTQPLSGGVSVHVDDIIVTREALNGNRERGVATVLIVDELGAAVAGATVNGVFSGPSSGNASGTTGSNGYATINSKGVKNPSGNWCYEVTNVSISGGSYDNGANTITQSCEGSPANNNILGLSEQQANHIKLIGVYPNPFQSSTRISFRVPREMKVSLGLYNLLGERIVHIEERTYVEGNYVYDWQARDVQSGTYILQIKTGSQIDAKRIIRIR